MRRIVIMVCILSAVIPSAWAQATKPAEKTQAAKPKEEAKKPDPIVCPKSIEVEDQVLDGKVEGWRYFNDADAKSSLDTIYVYTQKKTMAKLDPTKGTESFTEWTLPDNGKEKYFIVCSYTRTSVVLKKQIDASIKRCRVSFEADPAKPALPALLHKITCE